MTTSRKLPTSYNEKTYGASGTRDYTSLATWESDTDTDLVTASKGEILTVYGDNQPYNDYVNLESATTNSSYFRVVRGASGHKGTKTSGACFICTSTSAHRVFLSQEAYCQFHDLSVKLDQSAISGGTGYSQGFYFAGVNSDYNVCVGCLAWDIVATGTNYSCGFLLDTGNYQKCINCIADNVSGGSHAYSDSGFLITDGGGTKEYYIYNCTSVNSVNSYHAYEYGTLTVNYKNCIAMSYTTAFKTLGSPTENNTTNVTSGVTFDTDGYHLASNDTVAIDNGTDLSSDGVFAFDDDFDGDTRTGDWDIGADEYIPTKGFSQSIIII